MFRVRYTDVWDTALEIIHLPTDNAWKTRTQRSWLLKRPQLKIRPDTFSTIECSHIIERRRWEQFIETRSGCEHHSTFVTISRSSRKTGSTARTESVFSTFAAMNLQYQTQGTKRMQRLPSSLLPSHLQLSDLVPVSGRRWWRMIMHVN